MTIKKIKKSALYFSQKRCSFEDSFITKKKNLSTKSGDKL
ncbi:hypothetical protein RU95_GL003386 [Enterococcus avium]|nr:hypothetical protein RU95_GL003386 [Enterococcus avium]